MDLIIFGAGSNGSFYLNNYISLLSNKYENIYFFDNNKSLWGSEINGRRIISIEELISIMGSLRRVEIVIACREWKDLYKQCCELRIEEAVVDIIALRDNPFRSIEENVFSKYGYVKSLILKQCVDYNCNPIPWYTYPAIEYLEEFDMTTKRVFEYGSGYSSYYWALRSETCISVEHDYKWYEYIRENKTCNQEIVFCAESEKYADAILDFEGKFDVIVIDGRWRDLCAKNAIKCISEDGLIVFDNSERVAWDDEYKNAAEILNSLDFIRVDFKGIGPLGQYAWATSIYISRSMRYTRKGKVSPILPIGGMEKN